MHIMSYFKKYNLNINHKNLNYLVVYDSCVKTILEKYIKIIRMI